jgi:hypothetical protein
LVDLLRWYSSLAPEVAEALNALSGLPGSMPAGETVSVASPPRKLRGRPPRSIIAQMILDYQAGLSTRDVAGKYDLPKTSALMILRAEGVLRPREQITEAQIRQASRLIQQGDTFSKAAAQLGVASSTLRYQLKRRGLPTRPG